MIKKNFITLFLLSLMFVYGCTETQNILENNTSLNDSLSISDVTQNFTNGRQIPYDYKESVYVDFDYNIITQSNNFVTENYGTTYFNDHIKLYKAEKNNATPIWVELEGLEKTRVHSLVNERITKDIGTRSFISEGFYFNDEKIGKVEVNFKWENNNLTKLSIGYNKYITTYKIEYFIYDDTLPQLYDPWNHIIIVLDSNNSLLSSRALIKCNNRPGQCPPFNINAEQATAIMNNISSVDRIYAIYRDKYPLNNSYVGWVWEGLYDCPSVDARRGVCSIIELDPFNGEIIYNGKPEI